MYGFALGPEGLRAENEARAERLRKSFRHGAGRPRRFRHRDEPGRDLDLPVARGADPASQQIGEPVAGHTAAEPELLEPCGAGAGHDAAAGRLAS